MTFFLEVINLKMEMQYGSKKHTGKVVFYATLTLCDNFKPRHCVLEESENEFDLPAIGIDEHDLKGAEIKAISHQFIGCDSEREFYKTKNDICRILMVKKNFSVTYMESVVLYYLRHINEEFFHCFNSIVICPHDDMCVRIDTIAHDCKGHIPTIKDIDGICMKRRAKSSTFI